MTLEKEVSRLSVLIERLLGREESDKATKPSVVNVSIVSANTEYSHKLPVGCKKFQAQLRTAADLKMAVRKDVLGSATPDPEYFTVKSGTVYKERNLNIRGDVWLYFQAGAGTVVEIVQWS